MKLELKHLAPYLPYRLKIQGQTNHDVVELNSLTPMTVNITGRTYQYGAWADIFDISPILRPLSDLTKEIEHNGEKVIPIEILEDDISINVTALIRDDYRILNLVAWDGIVKEISFNEMFEVSQKLFEWHFDVFGLIDEGLAVDINKIEKK